MRLLFLGFAFFLLPCGALAQRYAATPDRPWAVRINPLPVLNPGSPNLQLSAERYIAGRWTAQLGYGFGAPLLISQFQGADVNYQFRKYSLGVRLWDRDRKHRMTGIELSFGRIERNRYFHDFIDRVSRQPMIFDTARTRREVYGFLLQRGKTIRIGERFFLGSTFGAGIRSAHTSVFTNSARPGERSRPVDIGSAPPIREGWKVGPHFQLTLEFGSAF